MALSIIPLSSLADGGREKSAVAVFNEYCLNIVSNFSSLSARATAENLKIELERDIPIPNGGVMKQKNWLIPSFGKPPLMLTSNDVTNGPLHVFGCGIYVPDANGEFMETALSALPRMAAPTRRSKIDNGASVTWWQARVGENLASEDSEVMLSANIPGTPGAAINLLSKTHLENQ